MNTEPFVIERLLNAPAEKVWNAIADRHEMAKWYFNLARFEPVVGFEFEFEGGTEEKTYLHRCRVTEVVMGKKLAYTWRYEGYDGNSLVTFELFPEDDKTLLRLTHSGLHTFPQHRDFDRKNYIEGWNYIIGTSIKLYVEKEPV